MTQVRFYDRVRVVTATTGTGSPLALGAAVDGFRSFAGAGVPDGVRVPYTIEDGSAQEVGAGLIGGSATTMTREVSSSSNSDNPIDLSGSAEVFITPTAASLVGRQTIGVPLAAATAQITNGAIALREEMATNLNMITGFRFPQGVDRHVQFEAEMPLSWDLGNLVARFRARAPVVTTGDAQFLIQAVAIRDDTPSDIAFGAAATIKAAVKSTAGNVFWTAETPVFAAANAPAHPCALQFRVTREGSHASDTALGDVDLRGLQVGYDTLSMHDTP